MHTVDQIESPYSPPDSDGTPLGSPNEQRILSSVADCNLVLPDIEGRCQTPNNHVVEAEHVTKPSSSSPVRLVWLWSHSVVKHGICYDNVYLFVLSATLVSHP